MQPKRIELPALLLLACLTAPVVSPAAPSQVPRSPEAHTTSTVDPIPGEYNVLVIVLDDLGTEQLPMYDETPLVARTPVLNGLRAEGILFTHAYVNPVCSPSRASIVTGRYPMRHGVGAYIDPGAGLDYSLPDEEYLLGEMLEDALPATYTTGAFGKWHMTSFTDYEHSTDNGFERFEGHMGNNENRDLDDVEMDHYWWRKVRCTSSGAPPSTCVIESIRATPPVENQRNSTYPFDETTYDASVTRRDAIDWINAQGTTPWVCYVAFNPPHTPRQVPPFSLLGTRMKRRLTSLGYRPGMRPRDSGDKRLINHAMIEALDADIGKFFEPAGINAAALAKTVVIVMGDNGSKNDVIPDELYDHTQTLVPAPANHGKKSVYQLAVRIPMLAWGPVIPAPEEGATCTGLVEAADLWRTIPRVCGVTDVQVDAAVTANPTPPTVTGDDSVSFLHLLQDASAASSRDYVYAEGFLPNEVVTPAGLPRMPHLRAMTNGTYKYIRKVYSTHTVEELYDLRDDVLELTDISGSAVPEDVAALAELSGEMDAL